MGKPVHFFSLHEPSGMKASQEEKSFLSMPTLILHVLWPKCVIFLAMTTQYQVLGINQSNENSCIVLRVLRIFPNNFMTVSSTYKTLFFFIQYFVSIWLLGGALALVQGNSGQTPESEDKHTSEILKNSRFLYYMLFFSNNLSIIPDSTLSSAIPFCSTHHFSFPPPCSLCPPLYHLGSILLSQILSHSDFLVQLFNFYFSAVSQRWDAMSFLHNILWESKFFLTNEGKFSDFWG